MRFWNCSDAILMKIRLTAQLAALLAGLSLAPAGRAADTNRPVSLQQSQSAMLAGLDKGICYSGFRHGQHPDRGDGAVNPGEQEISEDLRILAGNGNFKMIRLYDSRTNSEVVLRLIRENKLPVKVLLGAWLSAELNNPGCPWLKPIPADVLAPTNISTRRKSRMPSGWRTNTARLWWPSPSATSRW